MDETQTTRRYLFILLFLGVIAALGLIFQSYLIDYLIQPAAMVVWLLWRLILSVNQDVYWTILITVGLLLAVRLAPARGINASRYVYEEHPEAPQEVEKWIHLLEKAPTSPNVSRQVHENLLRLFEAWRAPENGLETGSSNAWAGELPPEVAALLFPGRRSPWHLASLWEQVCQAAPAARRIGSKRKAQRYYAAFEKALQYLEAEMENPNDKF